MTSNHDYMEANRKNWDERVAVHVASNFYDVASLKAGKSSLLPVELSEIGDVQGKTLLHLQCHFGMDTLSWAREGATATGVDFSSEAIDTARGLAAELGIEARFVESNIYDLPSNLNGQFDIVFTSYGVLCWLPDIAGWARVAAGFVKPGGCFYIVEDHPIAASLDGKSDAANLRLKHQYSGGGMESWEEDGTYTDWSAKFANKRTYEFRYGLGEIVSALVETGLQVRFLHEFPVCAWQRLPSMERGDDGYWRLPGAEDRIPFIFSIKATKPA